MKRPSQEELLQAVVERDVVDVCPEAFDVAEANAMQVPAPWEACCEA